MIATRHQYAVTQERIRRFEASLAKVDGNETARFRHLHIRAIQDEIDALEDALAAYDELTGGEIDTISVARLADLPQALVKARLVHGFDQADLARVIRQPVAKIERWERDGYSRVPLSTMLKIAAQLPLEFEGDLANEDRQTPRRPDVKRGLRTAGLPSQVFDRIIVPHDYPDYAQDDEIDRRLQALFGFNAAAAAAGQVFQSVPLRFKLPGNAAQERTRAYASYVEGLSALVAKTQANRTFAFPKNVAGVFDWLFPSGEVDLAIAVRQCWTVGIGILPLRDRIAFHGACRRKEGKATIVLKQPMPHQSRWLFDLLHEVYHLIHESADFTLLEADETTTERRQSQEEQRANRFAAFVLTRGKVVEAIAGVIKLASGRMERLLPAVREIAEEYNIPLAILANLVAENIQVSSGRSWWAVATSLQPKEADPWKVVRDGFIAEANFGALDGTEHAMLRQCLETDDD